MKKIYLLYWFVSLMISSSLVAQNIPTQGQVAYYSFNNNANDGSGNNNHGIISGGTFTTDKNNTSNTAYQVAVQGGIRVANSNSLKFTTGFSFSVWVMPLSTAGIDGYGRNNNYGYHPIFSKNCDRLNFYAGLGYSSQQECSFNAGTWYGGNSVDKIPFSVGSWMHLAASYDGAQMKLYKNGKLLSTKVTKIDFTDSNNANLVIGGMNCWGYYFNGKIDELRLYNRSLTDAEVLALFQDTATIPTLSIGTSTFSAPLTSGSGTLSVSSNTNWTVSSDGSWLVPKVTTGTGNQVVGFDYQSNSGTTSRIAKLTFKSGSLSQVFTVTQAGIAPTLSIGTSTFSAPLTSGSGTLSVSSNTNWTVSSDGSWLVPKVTTGTGNQVVGFDYQSNSGTTSRIAKLTFKSGSLSQVFTVTQAGAQYILTASPQLLSFPSTPITSDNQIITINSNTKWQVSEKPNWVMVSPETGLSSGTLTVSVSNNKGYDIRQGELVITNGVLSQNIRLEQAGYKAVLSVLPTAVEAESVDGLNRFIDLFATSDWSITSNVTWLKVSTTTGQAGNAHIAFTIDVNTTLASRTGTIYITGENVQRTIVVMQKAGAPPVPATCGKPQNLKVSIVSDLIKATWVPVSGATRYKVWYSENSDPYVQRSSPTIAEYSGFYAKPSANACIRIEATCANGLTSESSAEVCVKTPPPSKCMMPPNFRYTILNSNTARFEWDAVPDIMDYSLSINGGTQMVSTTATYKDFAYQAGQTLCVQLSPNCPAGWIGWSKELCVGSISAKFATSTTQINALAKGGSPNVFVFSTAEWEVVNVTGGFFTHQITMTPQNNLQDGKITININENFSTETRTGSFVVRQKGGATSQTITVSITQAGQYVVPPPPVCDVPVSLGHTLNSNDWATVSWLPVDGASSYQVYAKFEKNDWSFLENSYNTYITKAVSPNTNFCFKVIAICANGGRSAESAEYCFDSRLIVYPNTQNVANNAGSFEVTLDASESWTASTDASWLSVSPKSGNAGKGQKLTLSYLDYALAGGRLAVDGTRVSTLNIKTIKAALASAKITQTGGILSDEERNRQAIKFDVVDISHKNNGVVIYTKNRGSSDAEVIFVVDMSKAQIIPKYQSSSSAKQVFEKLIKDRGTYFGENNIITTINGEMFDKSSNAKYSLQIENSPLVIGGMLTGKSSRFYQALKMTGYSGNFEIESIDNNTKLPIPGFAHVITGNFMNVTCQESDWYSFTGCGSACDNSDFYKKKENTTIISGIDTDVKKAGFEKMVIYIGKSTNHNACKLMKILGVPYFFTENQDGSIFLTEIQKNATKIVLFDGGGSSQAYGIGGYFKESETCIAESSPRKIPQTFTILATTKDIYGSSSLSIPADTLKSTALSVAMEEQDNSLLNIYPNPNEGKPTLTYNLKEEVVQNGIILSVTNMLGQVVLQQEMGTHASGQLQLNLSNQPVGIYIVRLQSGNYQVSKKIEIQR